MMPQHVTEFTFLDHYAPRYGIPVPRHIPGTADVAVIRKRLEEWGGKAVVKPDVVSTGRGKANGVVSVDNVSDLMHELKRVSSTEIGGRMPRLSYLEEFIPSKLEIYTAISYDTRSLGPSFTVSLHGGADVETIPDDKKATIPIDIFRGLDAYQASDLLSGLFCPAGLVGILSRCFVAFWDLFVSTGLESAEINPWRVNPENKPYACDFKATVDGSNYKSKVPGIVIPEYPQDLSDFEEEMTEWNAKSHQGQAHVSDLGGKGILPILFGGGVSTIITETLLTHGGDPMFLSDFGGNPPYERMLGTVQRCFSHRLKDAKLLLILGGKANNTLIDVTFQATADALAGWVEKHGRISIPVIIGRGGPNLVRGLLTMKKMLEYLGLPYVIFGPDTPVTMVAEYAARLLNELHGSTENHDESKKS
jgi:succinyl-CoA synthetase beta subunit